MLKDIRLSDRTGIMAVLGQSPNRIEQGIYGGSFSLDNCFPFKMPRDYNHMLGDRASYGVADTIEQVKDYYKDMIEDPTESFIISVVVVKKEDETSHGGRRRHKRGPYIGTKNPMQEYLYNEDDSITQAVCFHIYRITEFI